MTQSITQARLTSVLPALVALAAAVSRVDAQASAAPASTQLEQGFRTPPEAAKPRVWWHWMNGNVSTAGITADLEWMKRVGIGGMHAGTNHIEVRVTNLWPNRMIGDLQPGVTKTYTFTDFRPFTKDSRLLESGLLGPVRIERVELVTPARSIKGSR